MYLKPMFIYSTLSISRFQFFIHTHRPFVCCFSSVSICLFLPCPFSCTSCLQMLDLMHACADNPDAPRQDDKNNAPAQEVNNNNTGPDNTEASRSRCRSRSLSRSRSRYRGSKDWTANESVGHGTDSGLIQAYNYAIRACAEAGLWERALELMEEMHRR